MANLELGEPVFGCWALADALEDAVAIRRTGVAEVVVEVAFVVGAADAPKVAAELFMPLLDHVFGIGPDGLGMDDLGLLDCDAADDDGIEVDAALLAGPDVTHELRAEVPLLGPILTDATTCGLLVPDDGAGLVLAEHVEAAGVEEW